MANQFQDPQPNPGQNMASQYFQNTFSTQVPPPTTPYNGLVNFNTDIEGLFETVSVVPTLIPKSPYDQVKFYSNSTTYRLYIYDSVNNVWRYATLT